MLKFYMKNLHKYQEKLVFVHGFRIQTDWTKTSNSWYLELKIRDKNFVFSQFCFIFSKIMRCLTLKSKNVEKISSMFGIWRKFPKSWRDTIRICWTQKTKTKIKFWIFRIRIFPRQANKSKKKQNLTNCSMNQKFVTLRNRLMNTGFCWKFNKKSVQAFINTLCNLSSPSCKTSKILCSSTVEGKITSVFLRSSQKK